MNPNEIKKTLECCINDDCDNCPNAFGNCEHNLMSDALAYINQLESDLTAMRMSAHSYKMHCEKLEAKVEELSYKLGGLLCHATDGKLSKHTYPLKYMETFVNDIIQDYCDEAKSEAVKEFADELKCYLYYPYEGIISSEIIDDLVKEMVIEVK